MLWICSEADLYCHGTNQKLSVFRTNTKGIPCYRILVRPSCSGSLCHKHFFANFRTSCSWLPRRLCRRTRFIVCTGLKASSAVPRGPRFWRSALAQKKLLERNPFTGKLGWHQTTVVSRNSEPQYSWDTITLYKQFIQIWCGTLFYGMLYGSNSCRMYLEPHRLLFN